MSSPMLEHFHYDPSSCSSKLKLLNFPPGVFLDLCLTCLPLTVLWPCSTLPLNMILVLLLSVHLLFFCLVNTSLASPPGELIIQLK